MQAKEIMVRAITLILVWLLMPPLAAQAQPLKVVRLSTHNLCPYGCYDESGRFDGYAFRVVTYALRQMGIALELSVVPWKRAQTMAKSGEMDGFFAASQNEERDRNGHMSAIIAEQKWNWYLLKENPLDPRDASFKAQAEVAGFIGANMLLWLNENGYNVVATPKDTERLVHMLLAKRFDACLANNYVMEVIIEREGLQGRFKFFTLKNKPLGVYFTNRFIDQYPDFLDRFNKHVDEYRKANQR